MRGTRIKFSQILREIETGIQSGALQPGQRLLTERELAAQYGCSLPTVNKAMAQLEEKLLITRSSKRGTFVRDDVELGLIPVIFDLSHLSGQGNSPFYHILMQRLQEEIRRHGRRTHFVLGQGLTGPEFDNSLDPKSSLWKSATGVVAMGALSDFETELLDRSIPTVTISSWGQGRHRALLDYAALGRTAAGYLLGRGFRRIAFLSHTPRRREDDPGYLAFLSAHAEVGAEPVIGLHRFDLKTAERTRAELASLFARPDRPDALLVMNDLLGLRVETALQELGIKAGRDIEVVCHATTGVEIGLPASFHRCAFDMDELCATVWNALQELTHHPERIKETTLHRIAPTIVESPVFSGTLSEGTPV